MRSNREAMILAAVLAAATVSGQAAAQTSASCEPACDDGQSCVNGACVAASGGAAAPAAARPTPRVAATPSRAAPNPLWSEGFMFLPSIGINSFQGDTGRDVGVGLRVGALAGSRMGENWSLNVGFAFDKKNLSGGGASDYVFDLGFSPLIHFPMEKLEIVAGPALGAFLDKASGGSIDIWQYGWAIGVNAGVLVPVGSKVKLGGLLNFELRNPMKTCITQNGNNVCGSEGLDSQKALALTLAAMF